MEGAIFANRWRASLQRGSISDDGMQPVAPGNEGELSSQHTQFQPLFSWNYLCFIKDSFGISKVALHYLCTALCTTKFAFSQVTHVHWLYHTLQTCNVPCLIQSQSRFVYFMFDHVLPLTLLASSRSNSYSELSEQDKLNQSIIVQT